MKTIVMDTQDNIAVEFLTFEQFPTRVGGNVEFIRFTDDASAYINQEGKVMPLPVNQTATALCAQYHVGLHTGDYIACNMIICGAPDANAIDTDVPDRLITEIVHG